MRGLLIVAFCAVYSVEAWTETFGPLHIETHTGTVPRKYFPLTEKDQHATRKAGAFVSFIRILPQLNPLKVPSLGPYNVALPDVNFEGNLKLTKVVVTGLKSVSLPALELRMAPGRIDFNATAPFLTAETTFELTATLEGQPLKFYGHMIASLRNLLLSAVVGPKIENVQSRQVYQVDSADVDIDLQNLQVSLELNQYSEAFRRILNIFLNNPQNYSGIVDDLLRAVLKAINNELTQITAREILQYLLGSAQLG